MPRYFAIYKDGEKDSNYAGYFYIIGATHAQERFINSSHGRASYSLYFNNSECNMHKINPGYFFPPVDHLPFISAEEVEAVK